jgi:hypothetical protein
MRLSAYTWAAFVYMALEIATIMELLATVLDGELQIFWYINLVEKMKLNF